MCLILLKTSIRITIVKWSVRSTVLYVLIDGINPFTYYLLYIVINSN